MSEIGNFCLVLHSHLPWVIGHGIWPHGMDWVNEAAAETYIPILIELNKLIDDGYHPKLTIGLTPVLCEMLRHPRFVDSFLGYLDENIALRYLIMRILPKINIRTGELN